MTEKIQLMTIGEILAKIDLIRIARKKRITNFYGRRSEDHAACYQAINGVETIVFLINDQDIRRVFFFSTDEEELARLLKRIPGEAVIDYITKNGQENAALFETGGFIRHAVLHRYSSNQLEDCLKRNRELLSKDEALLQFHKDLDGIGEWAGEGDVKPIYFMLHQVFDNKISHLCGIEELRGLVGSKNVVIQRDNDRIVALYINKLEGKKLYFYQGINQGQSYIIKALFCKCLKWAIDRGAEYSYCWVDTANARAVRYHHSRGFKPDGLQDVIFVKTVRS